MSKELVKTTKDWLQTDQFKAEIAKALPKHLTPERFIRVALTTLTKVPKLAQCSKESIFKCMLDLSSLGLEPDGRRAHIIPYGTTATLIIDYKGLIELAKRSGEVAFWKAETVCDNDYFEVSNGLVTHKINYREPRGEMYAVYSHVKNTNGLDDYEVMTMEDVEKIRKRSKAGNAGPWVTDFSEMAKKTVIRRHSKRLTLSPEFQDALIKDQDSVIFDSDFPSTEEMMPKRKSEVQADIEIEPEPPMSIEIEKPEPLDEQPEAPSEPKPETKKDKVISATQIKMLYAIGLSSGLNAQQVREYVESAQDCRPSELGMNAYDDICNELEAGK